MNVRELTKSRKAMGISQKQLSVLLKKTPTFICKLENGNRVFTPELQMQAKKALANARKKTATKRPATKKTVAKKGRK